MKKNKRTQQITSAVAGIILGILCALLFSGLLRSMKADLAQTKQHTER